jgi:hypothetical protein
MAEHTLLGINTLHRKAESVTHVSGTISHPCLGPFKVKIKYLRGKPIRCGQALVPDVIFPALRLPLECAPTPRPMVQPIQRSSPGPEACERFWRTRPLRLGSVDARSFARERINVGIKRPSAGAVDRSDH